MRLGAAQVTVCLVSDAEIAGMNERFRKKQGPTDVLSFPAGTAAKAATACGAEDSVAAQAD